MTSALIEQLRDACRPILGEAFDEDTVDRLREALAEAVEDELGVEPYVEIDVEDYPIDGTLPVLITLPGGRQIEFDLSEEE